MATMVKSMALEGIEGFPVEIEAATIRGQQQMVSIIGLGDQAVKEAGERIQAAITCYGYDLPKDKTLISLAPGNRRKRGSHYDLGMTLALLAETDQIAARDIEKYVFIGELSLYRRPFYDHGGKAVRDHESRCACCEPEGGAEDQRDRSIWPPYTGRCRAPAGRQGHQLRDHRTGGKGCRTTPGHP